MKIKNGAYRIRNWLHQPRKVLLACSVFFVASLLLSGTVWKVFGLYRDEDTIKTKINESHAYLKNLDLQLKQAKDPSYIERQAKDKLDLVNQDDLVFVFNE